MKKNFDSLYETLGGTYREGNVEAVKIKGNVVCNSLKCDKIEGVVAINKVEA